MSFDDDRAADAMLALLTLSRFGGRRAWKGYDSAILDRLHEQRFIHGPKGKAKSVVLTPEGPERWEELAKRLFAAP
jgi:hypothetical protein